MNVEHKPVEKVVLHNITRMTLEQIKHMKRVTYYQDGQLQACGWANGVVFMHSRMSEDATFNSLVVNDTVHISDIIYAKMETYASTLSYDEDKAFHLLILDDSNDPIISAVTKYLKLVIEA